MTEKTALRKQILTQRKALSDAQIAQASEALARQLYVHPLYRNARSLYAYLSYAEEVRTEAILRQAVADGKRVAVPKVCGNDLLFFWLTGESRIRPGYHGIPEPETGCPADDPEALVLMPGLAFDRAGHRMGYGGGFYDRYLAAHPHPTVALCFAFQLLDTLPTEAHDVPVNAVLCTEIP